MLLSTFVDRYLLEREVSAEYARSLHGVEREFSRWLKRPAKLADLFDEQINRWLADICSANGRARITLANKRCMMLVLWRSAWMDGLIKQPPKKVRRISAPLPPVTSWDRKQIARLLAMADQVDGQFKRSKVVRKRFWRAFILCGYYSGLRLGDLCRLRWDHVRDDGTIVTVQGKTKTGIVCRLRKNGLTAMQEIRSGKRVKIFGDCLSRQRIMRQFSALARQAGLAGGTKMLRRSGATMLEMRSPGWAKEHLGHKTSGLADRHYVDRGRLQQRKPVPPRIA